MARSKVCLNCGKSTEILVKLNNSLKEVSVVSLTRYNLVNQEQKANARPLIQLISNLSEYK